MRRLPAAFLVLTLLLGTDATGLGYPDQAVRSGPQAGEMIPGPFHFFNATGTHAGKPHCLVCEYGLCPVVVVFARDIPEAGAAQPLVTLLQKLDEAVTRYPQRRLHSFVVFLSNDATNPDTTREAARKLEDVARNADLKNVVVAVGGPDGPEGYHLSKDAGVTVVLYEKHNVIANFAFARGKMTDKDVSAVLAAVVNLVGTKK
jgi:hypothetical protein